MLSITNIGSSGSTPTPPPGPPPIPEQFEYLESFVGSFASGNFTITQSAWYLIFLWGASSGGGQSGGGSSTTGGAGGAGGATGGFCAHRVFLEAGSFVGISIDDARTEVSGEHIGVPVIATSGTLVSVTSTPGTASGGNITNLPGSAGGARGTGASFNSQGQITAWGAESGRGGNNGATGGTRSGGGGGGGGARATGEHHCRYVAPNMNDFSGGNGGSAAGLQGSSAPTIMRGSSIVITGAGSGSGGGGRNGSGASATTGQPGVVIIERGVG